MSNNPFADAVKPTDRQPITRHQEPAKPFFHEAIEADKLRRKAAKMTRQDMFNNGLLTVQDMDDEELRAGRMRNESGRIPRAGKTMDSIPRDLYDAMVQEHQSRTQERYRQNMDAALDTIVEIMLDPSVEPRDRLEAAKHVKEQVMGKTPERVQLQVSKAPWEDMFMDFANTTRERQAKLEQGLIDAEVVVEHTDSVVEETSDQGQEHGLGQQGHIQTWDGSDPDGLVSQSARITPAEPAPSYDKPASNSPLQYVTNSMLFRWEQCDANYVARLRAAAKKRINDAKKKRAAMRANGVMLSKVHVEAEFVEDPNNPDEGKLRQRVRDRD